MSQNSSRNAQRLGHPGAFSSTAGMTADAGKYVGASPSSASKQRVRQRHRVAGMCIDCGAVPPTVGLNRKGEPFVTCATCREQQRQYAVNYQARKRQLAEQEHPMTLMAERLQTANEINVAKTRFDQQPTSKVLIVGGRTTNLQRQAREHPRVIVWESTHLTGRSSMPQVPANVSVILLSRFCSHHVSDQLRDVSKKTGAFLFSGLLQTGQIRSYMATLLGLGQTTMNDGDDLGEAIVDVDTSRNFAPLTDAAPALPVSTPTPIASSEEQMEARLDEAVRLVTESMAALSVVRDELQATRDVVHQNREQLQTLRQLKSLLGKI